MSDALVARLRAAGCVFAEDEARLLRAGATSPDELDRWAAARAAGTPLEHVLGWAELRGVRVAVAAPVFVPRRRSGLLVELAVRLLPAGGTLVELCCGSGALALCVAREAEVGELHATDLAPSAVALARRNLAAVGGEVHQGDLDAALPARLAGTVDVLVANAPYVPTGELGLLPREARDHEQPLALDGGADGTLVQRRVVAVARRWLAPGGHLVLEGAAAQVGALLGAAGDAGLDAWVEVDEDVAGTAVVARRPARAPAPATSPVHPRWPHGR